MKKNTALNVAGLVFLIVATVHLLRLYYKFDIIINGYLVPLKFNMIGFVIALVLALWMFAASRSNKI